MFFLFISTLILQEKLEEERMKFWALRQKILKNKLKMAYLIKLKFDAMYISTKIVYPRC